MLHTFTAGEQRNAADVVKVKQNRQSDGRRAEFSRQNKFGLLPQICYL